jgi:hypothetical protein
LEIGEEAVPWITENDYGKDASKIKKIIPGQWPPVDF